MYSPIKVNGEWRIRYSHELYQLYKNPDIIQEIKDARFKLLGHLFTTDELNLAENLRLTNPGG